MASSPPQYTLLPSSPVTFDEKPPLHRNTSATPQTSSLDSPDSSSRARFRRAIFFTTGTLAITVLVASLYATNLALGGAGGCSRWRAGASETSHDEGMTRLRKRDAAVASPTYSTSTYTNGQTSTFVYTTRPIVNPGGYTIGTMTGYVVEKPTAMSESASTASAPASSTSASWSEVQAAAETASPTYSTSTGSAATSTYVYTTRPIVNPGGYTIGTLTGYVPIPTTATSSSTRDGLSTTTIPSSSPSATPTAAPLAERDFAEVDMHLLHRRGVNFEEAAEEEVATGKTEYSYSTKKDGATVTYVKTTRPIVNPGGYTIGTLDGAYVKAPQSTQLQTRDELKRRAVGLEA
ncbi:hypothetical protein BCR35DRAFT_353352 [Leucosporidium creatinivorum]|uniref:Uncharacterized protein n=1 Tax=Leucosporidium creatinivorum TaxID=106004 RepID=A0A1Y2EY52_9BASI|nr:hypothetical protein BCR35DRAFT_353352 [Leucosporidium creatinivorum]